MGAQLEVKAQEKPRSPKKGKGKSPKNKEKNAFGKLMNALKSARDGGGSPKAQGRKSSGNSSADKKKSDHSNAERIGRAGSIAFHIHPDKIDKEGDDSDSDEQEEKSPKSPGVDKKKPSAFFKGIGDKKGGKKGV